MSLMRWEPMLELESMRRSMDRVMDRMLEHWTPGRALTGLPLLESARGFMPNVEVFTKDSELILSAELPGIAPEEVNIEITEDSVHLIGEMKRAEEVSEDTYFRSERQYGRFDRLVALPERIRQEEAKATFEHGVLTICAPLAEPIKRAQARKLKIEQVS
ncbi:MAG: Hsp20/alpha crystallin family protein [Candidatus Sericytochromatia bacterium]|nr:Hsp20/alpha crystallin family protein [Candidatus Sericytochromatia bacterium]